MPSNRMPSNSGYYLGIDPTDWQSRLGISPFDLYSNALLDEFPIIVKEDKKQDFRPIGLRGCAGIVPEEFIGTRWYAKLREIKISEINEFIRYLFSKQIKTDSQSQNYSFEYLKRIDKLVDGLDQLKNEKIHHHELYEKITKNPDDSFISNTIKALKQNGNNYKNNALNTYIEVIGLLADCDVVLEKSIKYVFGLQKILTRYEREESLWSKHIEQDKLSAIAERISSLKDKLGKIREKRSEEYRKEEKMRMKNKSTSYIK